MILHTIINEYDVFYSPAADNVSCLTDGNRFIECVQQENGLHIRRINSTDLNDYLNPQFDPGSTYLK